MLRFRRRQQQLTVQPQSDRYAVTTAHARSLAELTSRPTIYTQRTVEQLSFVPTGGQQWVRTLQVKLPDSDEIQGRSWWIVPLGQFQLRRFADIFVTDSSEAKVDLLTRQQHGIALTKATLATHLFALPDKARERLEECKDAEPDYRGLRGALERYFTTVDKDERESFLRSAVGHYVSLLQLAGLDKSDVDKWKARLLKDFEDTSKATKYLCWVMAEAGELVDFQVSYTTTDPEHKLKQKNPREASKSLVMAFAPSRSGKRRDARRKVWSNWYRQLGLGPFNYQFKIPTHRHTSSYYFTIEAPTKSYVTYLDWETSNSFEMTRWTAHIPAPTFTTRKRPALLKWGAAESCVHTSDAFRITTSRFSALHFLT